MLLQCLLMIRYLNNEKATAETILPDGFLRTGDIAKADEHGNYWIVERYAPPTLTCSSRFTRTLRAFDCDSLKELIKVKGFQVAPAELEALLLEHPELADAAVIPKPDPASGELPVAYVVRAATPEGAALTAAEVKDFVRGRVAPYKQLKEVHFIDAIPKSAAGKILRRVLRAQAAEQDVA